MRSRRQRARRAWAQAILACGFGAAAFACAQLAGITANVTDTKETTRGDASVPSKVTGITLSADTIEVRAAACNRKSSVEVLEIANGRKAPIAFTAEFAPGTGFNVEGAAAGGVLHGEIGAGETKPVSVSVTSETPGTQEADLLINFAGQADDARTQRVRVKATVGGGKLSFLPGIADFGEVRYQSGGAPIPVGIANSGTAPVTITGFTPAGVFLVSLPNPAVPLIVPAGQSVTVTATLGSAAGADPSPLKTSATPLIGDNTAHCGTPPSLELAGKRISTDVNVEPSTIDFGKQYCTRSPAGQKISLHSYATNQVYGFTAALASGSRFTLSPTSGSVAAGGSQDLLITPLPIDARLPAVPFVDEALTITFTPDPMGGQVRTARVKMEIRGVILSVTPQPPSLSFALDGGAQSKSYRVTNTGNIGGFFTYNTLTPTMGTGAFTLERDRHYFFGNGDSTDNEVTFQPAAAGSFAADITTTVQNDPPLCVPADKVKLTGTRQ